MHAVGPFGHLDTLKSYFVCQSKFISDCHMGELARCQRMENAYESENFKIRLPYQIKRNVTCHGFGINFFLSFIFYLFNKSYLARGSLLTLRPKGLKLTTTLHLPQVAYTLRARLIETF